LNGAGNREAMKAQGDQMKCPKCGRLELREAGEGVTCRVCGYGLSPGEADKFRLFKLLREESKKK
jgi:ribosomal protein L37AE/L43A